jgi:hypothetical protein
MGSTHHALIALPAAAKCGPSLQDAHCHKLTSTQSKLSIPGHSITLIQNDQLELVAAAANASVDTINGAK